MKAPPGGRHPEWGLVTPGQRAPPGPAASAAASFLLLLLRLGAAASAWGVLLLLVVLAVAPERAPPSHVWQQSVGHHLPPSAAPVPVVADRTLVP